MIHIHRLLVICHGSCVGMARLTLYGQTRSSQRTASPGAAPRLRARLSFLPRSLAPRLSDA